MKTAIMRIFDRCYRRFRTKSTWYAGDDPAIDEKTVRLMPPKAGSQVARLEKRKSL